MTIKKYADIKFEYLSYCLKVKEMDDEEYAAAGKFDLFQAYRFQEVVIREEI